MKIGGQMRWNGTPICETSKIYYLMGRHPMEGVDCSSDTLCTRGEFGRVTTGCRQWGVANDGRIWNLLEKSQCERGDISQRKRRIYFPVADGRIKTLGGDQGLRTSTLVRHRPIQGESNIDFLGESEGSLPPPHDSFPDAGEAINDFWSMSGNFIYRHRVEPRVKLYSPSEESFHIKIHRRIQNCSYEFGCQARATHRRPLEHRWIKRFVWLLDRFHSGCSIGRKTSWRIHVVRCEINKKTGYIQARLFMARTLDEIEKTCPAEGEAKVVTWKARTR